MKEYTNEDYKEAYNGYMYGNEKYISTQEFAEKLGITRWTVRQWIISGRLPAARFGRRYYIRASEIERNIKRRPI